MKDFFISYNKADRAWAEWIGWQLEEAGYATIVQAWDFRPGSNFALDMQRAAVGAERTIAVLSPDYLAALFTQPEWAAAFVQDPTGEKGTLLPVRVRECDIEGMMAARLTNIGGVLRRQGDLAGAKSFCERGLAIDEAELGTNHPDVAIDLNNLSNVLREQGDLVGAKGLCERALRIFREFLGDDHPYTRTVEENLSGLDEELKNAK